MRQVPLVKIPNFAMPSLMELAVVAKADLAQTAGVLPPAAAPAKGGKKSTKGVDSPLTLALVGMEASKRGAHVEAAVLEVVRSLADAKCEAETPLMQAGIDSLGSTDKDAPAKFMGGVGKMLGHVFSNFALSLTRGVGASISTATRSSSAYKDGDKLVAYHEAQLLRLSANFAFAADITLLLGGRLKFEELLMGRMADAMGSIFLGYATLHHFQRHRHIHGLEALAESALLQLEAEAQTALREAAENFP